MGETGASQIDTAVSASGPLFVCGRQHSGNTVTTCVFEMVPDCLALNVEGHFFEQVGIVERLRDPQRRAERVVRLLRLEDARLATAAREWLAGWMGEHPKAGAVEAYIEAMRFVTEGSGKRFWVRRATSYIFHADEILSAIPSARIVYLLRNPYDCCASLKRRGAPALLPVWVLSWNRGLRIARRLERTHPNRILLIRYEDMVRNPSDVFQRVFAFAGVPFQERYLDVPHVNRSEAKQTRTSTTRGLNVSRVYYYRSILTPGEIAAVDMVADRDALAQYYPDLPHRPERRRFRAVLKGLAIVALSPLKYAGRELRLLLRHDPSWRLRRLWHRARTMLRLG